jgi:hypothetical protein
VGGAAWARETKVTGVEVRTDGAQTWAEAEFLNPARRHVWRRWKFDRRAPREPGRYTLLPRARAADGSAQSEKHVPSYCGYVITHPLPIEVFVDGPAGSSG